MEHVQDPLCARLATNVDTAFAEVVLTHQDLVFGVALRMLGDDAAAQDVAQAALIRAYGALKRYPAERVRQLRLRAWLARITLNAARNEIRARRNHADIDQHADRLVAAGDGPARIVERADERQMWARLLAQLPERQRIAVGLRHVDGLSYAEMAEALDRPIGSLKSDVHRGVNLLRSAYDSEQRLLEQKEAV